MVLEQDGLFCNRSKKGIKFKNRASPRMENYGVKMKNEFFQIKDLKEVNDDDKIDVEEGLNEQKALKISRKVEMGTL